MWKYRLAIAATVLSLVGAVLLFYSFQATSTDFILVTTKDNRAALCVGDRAMFAMDPDLGLNVGTKCPEWQTARPTAVVNTEHPAFAGIGFASLLLGFVLQLLSIEKPHKYEFSNAEWKQLKKLAKYAK